jgi:ankyrin repeat protein
MSSNVMTGLHWAARFNHPQAIVARQGHTEVSDLLLKAKASQRIKDIYSETALDRVIDIGHYSLQLKHVVRELVRAGADVGKPDSHGRTALHIAAEDPFYDDIPEHIRTHAVIDLETRDENGETARHYAVGAVLLDLGAARVGYFRAHAMYGAFFPQHRRHLQSLMHTISGLIRHPFHCWEILMIGCLVRMDMRS